MPKVSIVVPCFNQAQYLPEALDSVLLQTYPEWECIIVNDGSPDNTEEVASEWCKKDSRIKYLKKGNGGLSSARNRGIRESSGELILPLDADDLIAEIYLEKAVKHFMEFPDTKVVYCKAELFGDWNGEWDLGDYQYEKLLFDNIIFCSSIYKKKDYDKTHGYNETLNHGLEDWDFWLSLLNESDLVYKIPLTCFFYRIRQDSMIRSMSDQSISDAKRNIYNAHKEKFNKYIPELIWENRQIKEQQLTITALNNEIQRIQASKAYRLGKFIIKPLSALRYKFRLRKY